MSGRTGSAVQGRKPPEPIANGTTKTSRALVTVEFAAEIMVVAAMNPWPCRRDFRNIPVSSARPPDAV